MAVIKILEEKFGDRPVSEVVYEDENAKVVRFYVREGQEIKPHKSPSSVYITVLKGRLSFYIGKDSTEREVEAGGTVFYEPDELHGFRALEDSVVEAVITPKPTRTPVNLS
ncbi:MAG: cupin domain-containing protein [Aquificae bacterium]|nr:cupin domain-containing protein [Aquificota bacterium]